MCSIAIEKSCRVALNVIGNIAHSTCYHSFFLRNDIFINNNCIFIWLMTILMFIFAYINFKTTKSC